MEIFRLFGSIFVDNDEANQSIAKTDEHAEGLGKKLGNGIKTAAKWGAAIALAAGTAAIALGVMSAPLVKSAANAQALNAQFEQVFGDIQNSAQETVNKLGKDFGMVPNRIKPAMTQMTSMFKGLGMNTEKAMGTAKDAVTLVADAAAFYDKSFEDANSALNSFIKGNYEGGESIGLFANETQLAAYALRELGLDWKKLDEAGKQVARLEYAKAMQESAGATGQAARESDSLENQLGNLRQAWEDIKAKFGAPILDPAVQGIKKLVDILMSVDTDHVTAKLETFIDFIRNTFGSTFKTAYEVVDTFYNAFMSVWYDTGEVGDVLAKIGISPEAASKIEGFFKTLIDYAKTGFTFWVDAVSGIKSGIMMVFDFVQPYIMPILSAVVGFIQEQVAKVTEFWNANGQQIMQAVNNLFNGIMAVIQFIMPAVEFLIKSVWGNIQGIFKGALNIIMGLLKIFTGLFTGDWSKMWEGIKQLLGGAVEFLWNLFNLMMIGKLLGGIKAFISSGIGFFKNFGSSVVATFKGFIDDVITWFNYFRATGSSIWQALVDTIRNLVTIFKANIRSNFDEIWQMAVNIFTKIKDAIMNPIKAAKDSVKGFIDEIKGFFKGLKLELPKIKMPKFSIKNWSSNPVDWLKAMPSLGIEWNALGGIATGPTVINTSRGLQGFGEVPGESEAFLPLNDKVLGSIGRGIAATMDSLSSESKSIVQHLTINSPQQISPSETARVNKRALQEMALGW
nr:hypothetical protein [Fredinandcohnia onubensis]